MHEAVLSSLGLPVVVVPVNSGTVLIRLRGIEAPVLGTTRTGTSIPIVLTLWSHAPNIDLKYTSTGYW